ncbi:hypothetical protein H310_00415 [Aphanomyces invadans]|uniref:Intimal thickness related receptor IRP domain-containing protein n=1 Tax=Aphanomyces invadans TaxID=157072 RepID=A0A024UWI5_9STRA|nr:hypothetical protein H310_00415 [Aphanomyces invadans]ETW10008.1 hypothetical protein H310_00415 [Aphanomyces invadans]|eukprot:XP_008861419.1 hypothetical protein H310_00415 [Aphanomyces invadans]
MLLREAVVILCAAAAHASTWWERQNFVVGAVKMLPVVSYNFSREGGAMAFTFNSRMFFSRDGPVPVLLVCNDTAMAMIRAPPPDVASDDVCRNKAWRSQCIDFAFTAATSPAYAPFWPLHHRLSAGMLDRLSLTSTQAHFVLDVCRIVQNTTEGVEVTVDYCICDVSTGDCAGNNYSLYRTVYVIHALLWAGLGWLWLGNLRHGPRQFIHVPLTTFLVLKMVHTAVVCVAVDPSFVADELVAPRVGRIADYLKQTVEWVHLMVVFALADGFGTLWLNIRGCLFSLPFSGFPIGDANDGSWNPFLAVVAVSAILLVMQSLASRRHRVLFAAWMVFYDVGIDPTTTPIETKRRLLLRFVRISALYFAAKFVLELVFYCEWDSHVWMLDAVHETLLIVQAVAVGTMFRCREFRYDAVSRTPFPLPRAHVPEDIAVAPVATEASKFVVFSHPDGTTAYGQQLQPRQQAPLSAKDNEVAEPSATPGMSDNGDSRTRL